ncbi:MAG: TRAP transporter small permease subunit [Deltaproteobacteria bacterium]|nr:TRAP transporter small permease subunit [Deltaproteobacteria bacterium]
MKQLLSIIDGFNAKLGKITSFVMIPTLLCIYYEVVSRYVFGKPTLWASELMIYFCAILYILGAAWTLQVGRHVKIDMLYSKVSPRGQRVLDIFTFPFFTLYMGLLLWVGFEFAMQSMLIGETSGTPWDPPIYPIKILFFIGVLMLLMQGLAKLIRDVHFLATGKEL